MDYAALELKIQTHIEVPDGDTNLDAMLPDIINFGELRIYRDMKELLAEHDQDTALSFTSGNREITVPTNMFIVEALSFVNSGLTTPLLPVSKQFIDMIWPTQATTGTMQYFCMKDRTTAIVAGTPASSYQAVFTGYVRDDPLSSTNTTTYIGDNFPDLLFASCMIYAAGYQRDYGQQADDPQKALSWERMYQNLLPAAIAQEERKSGRGPGWTAHAPAPLAQISRE